MKKYTYDFTIPAFTEDEADAKVTALKMLAIKLTATELTKLALVVEKDPIKTALAKKLL